MLRTVAVTYGSCPPAGAQRRQRMAAVRVQCQLARQQHKQLGSAWRRPKLHAYKHPLQPVTSWRAHWR